MTVLPERPFELDPFQAKAIEAIDAGRSVLVAAPTGSGKTVVAEHACDLAVLADERAFYTSPIKALANQKYRDFCERYGSDRVGLLTGDNAVNGDANIVVMTTEVLRNMLYEQSRDLTDLRWVVLDEVHYLQDRYRGPVWEEVILHLDRSVGLVALSATVSNLDQLGEWLEAVRGPTDVVLSTVRPVPLREKMAVAEARDRRIDLLPLFVKDKPNPNGLELDVPKGERFGPNRSKRFRTPQRAALVSELDHAKLAPLIFFIFSRAGCDDAARQLRDGGLTFTDEEQQEQIRVILDHNLSRIDPKDLASLQLDEWADGVVRGIASHHAGLVPAAKEAVESAFAQGLITVVFATETLALGINMPARTVVIENLSKFNGETHEILTPLEYTQLVGRAGRRGKDDVGHAVTAWSPYVNFAQVTELAASSEFPLRSAFKSTYNMAANLVRRLSEPEAHRIIGRSFAQFQLDGEAVRLEQDLADLAAERDEHVSAMRCELGDVAEYHQWLEDREKPQLVSLDAIAEVMSEVSPGDVLASPDFGHVVVVSTASRKRRGPRVRVVFGNGFSDQITAEGLGSVPQTVATIELPQPFVPRDPAFQATVAERLLALGLGDAGPDGHAHPVAGCPKLEQHLTALDKAGRIERQEARVRTRLEGRQGRLIAEFEKVLHVLERRGYVADWRLTETGDMLASVYHESDLLLTESILQGLFDGLDVGEVAALASCFTYEHRSKTPPPPPTYPTKAVGRAAETIEALSVELRRQEKAVLGTERTGETEGGFANAAHHWATGGSLDYVLDDFTSAGEFVRNVKQLVDLLRQIDKSVADETLSARARSAAEALNRGVVRSSGDMAPALVDDDAMGSNSSDEADAGRDS